jgi:hypothetical protein
VGCYSTMLKVVLIAAAVVLAGCGGSGTHPQTFSPQPSSEISSDPTTPPPSTQIAPSPATAIASIPTPTVTAAAQDAVNAYIAFYNASGAADRDPEHADIAALDRYLTGKAESLFDDLYSSMKQQSLAYRGSAADPRVKVQEVFSSSSVFLTSCPLVSTSDPYTEYTVSTGNVVASAPPRDPPPPYQLTLPMVKTDGQWKLADVLQNTSKTCTG